MSTPSPRLCPLDGAPLPVHLRCWSCRSLVGPGHAITRLVGLGLCQGCRRGLDRLGGDQAPADGELMDTKRKAAALGVKPATVRKWARTGRLQAVELPGRGGDSRGRRLRFSSDEG